MAGILRAHCGAEYGGNMRTITAKYRGICIHCEGPIRIGDRINYAGPRQCSHVNCGETRPIDPDGDEAEARATYHNPRSVSNHFQIGGRDFYRNKRGRCEDAPRCGCCTI